MRRSRIGVRHHALHAQPFATGEDLVAQRVAGTLTLLLSVLVGLAMLLAPQIVDAMASGFSPEQTALAVDLTRTEQVQPL